ncbi:ABC transporter permease, partial [candidate division KSB1 bacterium]|nr:ABC transporter permease [candidate division KSB1 bacterium]
MLRHYLKIALRFFTKHKIYTIITLASLAIGLTAFSLVFLYAYYEMNYDSYHESSDRIYLLQVTSSLRGETFTDLGFVESTIKVIEESYPEIEKICRFHVREGFIRYNQNFYKIAHVVKTQPSFFSLFDNTPIYGDIKSALNDPYSVILTKSVSEKIFGKQNPVGKVVNVGVYNKCDLKISAVIDNLPANSHINADVFVSINNMNFDYDSQSYTNTQGIKIRELIYHVYLLLKEGYA